MITMFLEVNIFVSDSESDSESARLGVNFNRMLHTL